MYKFIYKIGGIPNIQKFATGLSNRFDRVQNMLELHVKIVETQLSKYGSFFWKLYTIYVANVAEDQLIFAEDAE